MTVKNNNTKISLIYVFGAITVIILLIAGVVYFKKENFCSCRNMTQKKCPSPENLTNLYNSGKLTEFTDFAKLQKINPRWKSIMPDDIFEAQMKDKWALINGNSNNKCH